jgi:hypothetical protein
MHLARVTSGDPNQTDNMKTILKSLATLVMLISFISCTTNVNPSVPSSSTTTTTRSGTLVYPSGNVTTERTTIR